MLTIDLLNACLPVSSFKRPHIQGLSSSRLCNIESMKLIWTEAVMNL